MNFGMMGGLMWQQVLSDFGEFSPTFWEHKFSIADILSDRQLAILTEAEFESLKLAGLYI